MTEVTNAVKMIETEEGPLIFEGYGVIFGGKDATGHDYFTKNTEFMMDLVPRKLALYDHTKQDAIKSPIGYIETDGIKVDDVGIWVRMQVDRHLKYTKAITALAKAGVLGLSSGAVAHLVQKGDDGHIKRWPLVEFSLTPTPAEPRTLSYLELKSLSEAADETSEALKALISLSEDQTEEAGKTSSDVENSSGTEQQEQGTKTMTQENGAATTQQQTPTVVQHAERPESVVDAVKSFLGDWKVKAVEEPISEVKESVKTLGGQVEKILEFMQSTPSLKGAGFFTETGGKTDPGIKNFADFLLAVKRQDTVRLAKVYHATKDLTIDSGSGGSYLVPQEYSSELLKMSAETSPIASRVRTINVSVDSGRWPALDQYLTPTAGSGQTAFAGGVVTTASPPGTTLTETQPSFEMLEWRLHKTGGYTEVDNELIEDSPTSIEALLSGLFTIAITAKRERNILRGSGVGEPLGILNAASAIGISPATNNLFSWADVASMWSRFKSAGGQPVWIIHPGVWPDILTMELGSAGANAWTASMAGAPGANLNGYSILTSEHMPQDDNAGNTLLADLSAYLLFERSGLHIAFSEHAGFLKDQGTWRFTQRSDGMPWLRTPITLADPQGSYTVSPFIYHND